MAELWKDRILFQTTAASLYDCWKYQNNLMINKKKPVFGFIIFLKLLNAETWVQETNFNLFNSRKYQHQPSKRSCEGLKVWQNSSRNGNMAASELRWHIAVLPDNAKHKYLGVYLPVAKSKIIRNLQNYKRIWNHLSFFSFNN